MRRLVVVALLVGAGCTEPGNPRYPSTLVVTGGMGRWCADGGVYVGGNAYSFYDRASGQHVMVPKASTVLSVRPDSSCTP